MGHASPTNMIAAIQIGTLTIEDVTPDLIRQVFQHEDCPACTMAKVTNPFLFTSQTVQHR